MTTVYNACFSHAGTEYFCDKIRFMDGLAVRKLRIANQPFLFSDIQQIFFIFSKFFRIYS